MTWPSGQDYNEAVQNPQQNFADPELRAGVVERTPLGLPRPITGGFATVYKVQCGAKVWAVRCFLREVPDQQKRYEAISRHLAAAKLPYTVGFDYQARGVRSRGQWVPILKMEWVHGDPLNVYIETHLHDSAALRSLADRWATMAAALQKSGLAHGDLQHGNVLIVNGDIKLIDYDGMYVPALTGQGSHENGHRNYQPPKRSGADFGPYLDNFSVWVIYISLVALSIDPSLWQQTKASDENLLFRKEDFDAPRASAALGLLSGHANAQLQNLAALFTPLSALVPASVPCLPSAAVVQPVASRSLASAGWLKDHLKPTSRRANAAAATYPPAPSLKGRGVGSYPVPSPKGGGAITPAPDWVKDVIAASQTHKRFQSSPFPLRVVVTLGLLLAVLLAAVHFPASIPAIVFKVKLAGLIGLTLAEALTLLISYQKDPTVRERKPLLAKRKEANAARAGLEAKMRACEAKRADVDAEEAEACRSLGTERAALVQKYRNEQERAKARTEAKSQTFDRRVQALDAPLQKLRQEADARINRFAQQLAQVNKMEADDLAEALRTLQEQHVGSYLKRQCIATAGISGVGPILAARLVTAGYITAAHLHPGVRDVGGVGDTKADALMDWRRERERAAQAGMPKALSAVHENMIRARYERNKRRLQQQIDDERQSLNRKEQALQSQNTASVQQIEGERIVVQAEARQEEKRLNALLTREKALLDTREQQMLTEFADRRKTIDAEGAALRKQMSAQKRQAGKIAEELEAYREITPAHYLRRLLRGK